jgi:hypothetical protein
VDEYIVSKPPNSAYRVCDLEGLTSIASQPEVVDLVAQVVERIDAIYMERGLNRAEAAEKSLMRGAWATAAMEGAEYPWGEMASLAVARDEPLVMVVRAAMRATTSAVGAVGDRALGAFGVIAKIGAAAGSGFVDEAMLGQPRVDSVADDPLHIGQLPDVVEMHQRLGAIAKVWSAPAEIPTLVLAGVIHAELALARPFAWGSGLVARAVPRYLFISRGLDPAGVLSPEMALWRAGRTSYVRALQARRGSLSDWVKWWLQTQASAFHSEEK